MTYRILSMSFIVIGNIHLFKLIDKSNIDHLKLLLKCELLSEDNYKENL